MNQRPAAALQSYRPPIQTSRAYSPSIFQNVRLGEAPDGVHIPPDSLLNVIRSSPTRSPSRNFENSPLPNNVNTDEQNNFQPEPSVQPDSPAPDSRRRSRQRSRTSNTSSRSMQRQTQPQSDDEEPQRITALVTSQRHGRQQTQMRNSGGSRRRDSNVAEKKPISPRREMSELSKPSQVYEFIIHK